MKHVLQKLLPFLAFNHLINDISQLSFKDNSKHPNIFHITVKNMILASLLITGCVIVGSSSDEYEKWKKIVDKETKAFIDSRNHKKANGTSSEIATINLTDQSLKGAGIVFSIGLCSYVVDNGLVLCDATKNIPKRRDIALGLCTSAYTALYASSEYEKIKKAQEIKKAKELQKSKELQDLEVSIKVENSIKAHEQRKTEELEKNSTYHYFTNEKSTYHWIVNGFGLYSTPTK